MVGLLWVFGFMADGGGGGFQCGSDLHWWLWDLIEWWVYYRFFRFRFC